MKFKMLYDPGKTGGTYNDLRLFRGEDGKVYIADNSGDLPDTTDDGAMFIDFDMPVAVALNKENSIQLWLFVRNEQNGPLYNATMLAPAIPVLKGLGAKFKLDSELTRLLDSLTRAMSQGEET